MKEAAEKECEGEEVEEDDKDICFEIEYNTVIGQKQGGLDMLLLSITDILS